MSWPDSPGFIYFFTLSFSRVIIEQPFVCSHCTVNTLRAVQAAPTASVPCHSISSINVGRPQYSRASVSTTCQQTLQSSSTKVFDVRRYCDNQGQLIALEPRPKQAPHLLPTSLRKRLRMTQHLNRLIITSTRPVKTSRLLRPE